MTTTIHVGDCRDVLRAMPDRSIDCCVTSPPYWGLRDYGHDAQIGMETTPEAFIAALVEVFREVRRVLREDGVMWLNIGDSYANDGKWGGSSGGKHAKALHGNTSIGRTRVHTGLKPKDLVGIPWMLAFALRADGWWLRQDVIWHKPNPMPESVRDRCTKSHEYVFLLTKSDRYHFDGDAIAEPAAQPDRVRNDRMFTGSTTRNRRSVWQVQTQPFSDAHFAVMPDELARLCIVSGCPEGGVVLDPFGGAGTTGLVADRNRRHAILIEASSSYADIARRRISGDAPLLSSVTVVERTAP